MYQPKNLVEMLDQRATLAPEQLAFSFDGLHTTYAEMMAASASFANYLRALGLQAGQRVVLALPNGPEFFTAFYGVLRLGAVAVPIFGDSGTDRLLKMVALCSATALVLPSTTAECKLAEMAGAGERLGFSVAMVRYSRQYSNVAETVEIAPQQLAFLQYTSGSTGDPKGVMLTHGNLITNVQQMIAGMGITAQDIFVSWLPVYHDMGLILKTMVPIFVGAPLHLLPANLTKVKLWLGAIQEHRATFTAAPDFAYRLCLRYIRNPEVYDLSSLRVALNAAEPVRASTVDSFQQAFGLGHVMAPAYGLAEATVGVCMWPAKTAIKVDARDQVSVGKPFPGITLKIIDEEGHSLNPDSVGEIAIKSEANCAGYLGNETATAALFCGDGYFRSGDMGYLDEDGDLFVIGRVKNVIISGGSTIAPKEVQEAVEGDERVRLSAAVGIDKGGLEGEQLVLFVEARGAASHNEVQLYDLALDLVNRVHGHLGHRPARLYLVKPHTIPRTPNGKIQHLSLKKSFLSGQLAGEGRILFPDY